MCFCVSSLSHLTTSSTTFTSVYHALSVKFSRVLMTHVFCCEISLFGTTMMKVSYGIDIQESNDPYIIVAKEAMGGIHEAGVPGAFWVDVFPALKYVPSWFPSAGFQKKAAHWREVNKSLIKNPFRYVKEQLGRDPFSQEILKLFKRWFCYRRMAMLHLPWLQTLLSVCLMRAILNNPWTKRLHKRYLLCLS